MTFADWVRDSAERYRHEPAWPATKKAVHGLRMGAQRRFLRFVGSPIWERGDWDVLVVLDACRVDQMQAVADDYDCLPQTIPSVWSNASCSIDWIDENFNGHPAEAANTAYVTANPFTDHSNEDSQSADLCREDSPVGHVNPLYRHEWTEVEDGIATVPPERVSDWAIATWRQRDELGVDRMVVHYMQPHEPYRSHPEWGTGDHKLLENLVYDGVDYTTTSIWPLVEEGEVPKEELWHAGVDNLRWVMDDVADRLLTNVAGEVVISADHGNAIGEWGEWHHPPGAMGPTVRKVPWVEAVGSDERTVTPGLDPIGSTFPDANPGGQTGEDDDADGVEEQLEALGYVDGGGGGSP